MVAWKAMEEAMGEVMAVVETVAATAVEKVVVEKVAVQAVAKVVVARVVVRAGGWEVDLGVEGSEAARQQIRRTSRCMREVGLGMAVVGMEGAARSVERAGPAE